MLLNFLKKKNILIKIYDNSTIYNIFINQKLIYSIFKLIRIHKKMILITKYGKTTNKIQLVIILLILIKFIKMNFWFEKEKNLTYKIKTNNLKDKHIELV